MIISFVLPMRCIILRNVYLLLPTRPQLAASVLLLCPTQVIHSNLPPRHHRHAAANNVRKADLPQSTIEVRVRLGSRSVDAMTVLVV